MPFDIEYLHLVEKVVMTFQFQFQFQKLWILRRLSEQGVSIEHMLLTYFSRVRVCVEQNVPLWNFSVSKFLKKKMENLQKISLYIILGKEASNDYFCNLAILNIVTLEERQQQMMYKFAKRILKHPDHRNIFEFTKNDRTRAGKKIILPTCKTTRYERTTIPSLALMINESLSHKI